MSTVFAMSSLSEDETDFLRLAILVIKVAPQAVRYLFDQRFPPANLGQILQSNKRNLRAFKNSKIINAAQWDLLFPSSGTTCSNTYDVTLLICLLRNVVPQGLLKIQKPTTGFDKLPSITDLTEGADIARIKNYRNFIAHHSHGKITKIDYNSAWTDLFGAISRIGAGRYNQDCHDLRVASLDGSDQEVYTEVLKTQSKLESLRKELDEIRKQTVPCNVQDRMNKKIELWEEKDTKFAETAASKALRTKVEENKCILITGNSGSGKSASCHHVALYLRGKGYNILPITRPKELLDYNSPSLQQVFVINDACGKYYADKTLIQEWLSFEEDLKLIMENNDLILLMNSRLIVYQDEHFEMMAFLNYSVVDFSNMSYALTLTERKAILMKHFPLNSEDNETETFPITKEAMESQDCFPLLCELFGENEHIRSNPEKFFTQPFEEYKKDLDNLKIMSPHKYCALGLLVIFEDSMERSVLSDLEVVPDVAVKIDQVCTSIGLPKGTSRQKLCKELESLQNIYVTVENGKFKSLHDKMYDFISSNIGTAIGSCLLEHCSLKFIRERVRLFKHAENDDQNVIVLQASMEKSYFKRMFAELKMGKFSELLMNRQVRENYFQEAMIRQFCNMDEQELQNLLFNLSSSDSVNNVYLTGRSLSNIIEIVMDRGDNSIHEIFGTNDEIISFNFSYLARLLTLKDVTLFHFIIAGGLYQLFKFIENRFTLCVKSQIRNRYDLCVTLSAAEGTTEILNELLSNYYMINIEVNEQDNNYYPLFLESCLSGKIEVAKCLHERNIIFPDRTKSGETAIWVACYSGHLEMVRFLISKKFDVNAVNKNGTSPLFIAVKRGHREVVDLLLENHADIHLCKNNGAGPLFAACEQGNIDIVELLLKLKANPNLVVNPYINYVFHEFEKSSLDTCSSSKKTRGLSSLFVASQKGFKEICQLLLVNGANVDLRENHGKTPLMIALQNEYINIVELLLKYNADVNAATDNGITPLTIVSEAGNLDLMELLFNHGSSFNTGFDNQLYNNCINETFAGDDFVNKFGSGKNKIKHSPYPLAMAARKNHLEVVKFLLDKGFDINYPGVESATALFEASEKGNVDIVTFLLSCPGININRATCENRTPLYIAVSRKLVDIVKILLQNGANPNICRRDGVSPLMKSVLTQRTEIVKLLLEYKADPDIRADNGFASILCAVENNENTNILEMLLSFGANVNLENNSKQTALWIAVKKNRISAIRCLLQHNASVNVKDDKGDTALIAALKGNIVNENVIQLLLDHEADVNTCNLHGTCPLLCATVPGNINIVESLLSAGADANIYPPPKPPLLVVAVEKGYNDIAKMLLQHNAIVDATDNKSETALWKAVRTRNNEAVNLLLEHGAKYDYRVNGISPCELAMELNCNEIVELLKSKQGYFRKFLGTIGWIVPLLRDNI